MNIKNLYLSLLFFLLLTGLGHNACAQRKNSKKQPPLTEKSATPALTQLKQADTVADLPGTDPVAEVKKMLIDKYRRSDKSKIKDTATTKQILSVGWFDSEFREVTRMGMQETISIVVLTKSYKVGDSISVTIGARGNDESLIAGVECDKVTFFGTVNYEDIAVLKDIFFVEGAQEQLVITPEWKDRYICKQISEEEKQENRSYQVEDTDE